MKNMFEANISKLARFLMDLFLQVQQKDMKLDLSQM